MPYWRGFWTLSVGRQTALGYGAAISQAIPYSEISVYAHDWGFADHPDELQLFTSMIQAMDLEYRAEMSRIAERNRASKAPAASARPAVAPAAIR